MIIQKLGVLGLIDEKTGELVAIVHHNEKNRAQVFYTADKCGMDEIESLLKSFSNTTVCTN